MRLLLRNCKSRCLVAAAKRVMEAGAARGPGDQDPFVLATGCEEQSQLAWWTIFGEAAKRAWVGQKQMLVK